MRGITFQKPFELIVQIPGESWHQGDRVSGTLTIKNRASESVSIENIGLALALGGLRKVKEKAANELPDDAFKELARAPLELAGAELAAGAERSLDWAFTLDRNSPVTDSSKSLFIVYGQGKDLPKLAHLELNVKPFPVIEEFLSTLKTQFRFVAKTMRSAKGPAVEVKLAPPASKTFAMLETLVVTLRMEDEQLAVKYSFNVKKVEAAPGAVETSKKKIESEQTFDKIQYLLSSGRINSETFESGIREALAKVESKIL